MTTKVTDAMYEINRPALEREITAFVATSEPNPRQVTAREIPRTTRTELIGMS